MQTNNIVTSTLAPTQITTNATANSPSSTASFASIYASVTLTATTITTTSTPASPPIIGFVDSPIDFTSPFGPSVQSGNSVQSTGTMLIDAMPVFAANLRRACDAYGISMRPPIQLVTQADGSVSAPAGDPRAAKIKQMFSEQPQLAHQYQCICSTADRLGMERDADAEKMVAAKFGQAFADQACTKWGANELMNGNMFGVSFNGINANLTERVNNTWQAPRTTNQIADEMVPGTLFLLPPTPIDAILAAA
jgi:hypothetical protein